MSENFKIREAEGTWVVRAGGAVIGETDAALELSEGSYPAVIFFPRDDIAMAFLERSETTTQSPQMGTASYFSIVTKSTVLKDAAWSYEAPLESAGRIANHVAFHTGDLVTVEEI